jgi:hypothetical protein
MLADPTPRVIAFGGGTATITRVRHAALERATVVTLTASADAIIERARAASLPERPNLLSASPLDGDGDGVVTLAEKIAAFTPIALGTPSAAANHSFLPAGGIKLIPQLLIQCHEEMRLEISLSQQLDWTATELTQSVIGLIEDTIEQMRIDDH